MGIVWEFVGVYFLHEIASVYLTVYTDPELSKCLHVKAETNL